MDQSIKQLSQDLALAKYAKGTCSKYLKTAEHLSNRFGRPLAELGRDQLRTYVEEITGRGKSASWVGYQIAALSFLYRKTLGRPDVVSFLSYPRRKRSLPTVRVVGALLGHASLQSTAHYARVTEKLVRQTPSPLDLLPQKRW